MPAVVRSLIAVATASILSLFGAPAAAQPADLSVITFPGSGRWPLWVAQDRGIDVSNGIRLKVLDTRNSVDQMTGLIDGRYDIAITAFDNVVAYHVGVGSPEHPPAPVVAVMGLDAGLLSLVARPEFRSVGDLKGQTLAVDALTTGYPFALRETLRRAGLGKDDYTLVSTGGTHLRYEALTAGRVAATLLMPPFTAMADGQGLRRLADVSRTLGHYQGTVVAVRSDWAARNARHLTHYIAAYRQALAWLYDPANRQAAIAIYSKHLPDSSEQAAEVAYATLVDPVGGFWRNGDLDMAGMGEVLTMRARYAPPGPELGEATRYFEPKYLAAAKRLRLRAKPR